jgi:hypothetical protein
MIHASCPVVAAGAYKDQKEPCFSVSTVSIVATYLFAVCCAATCFLFLKHFGTGYSENQIILRLEGWCADIAALREVSSMHYGLAAPTPRPFAAVNCGPSLQVPWPRHGLPLRQLASHISIEHCRQVSARSQLIS